MKETEKLQRQISKLKHSMETKYIGNSKTGKYHVPECRFAKSVKNKVSLKNKTGAKRLGYKACKCIK